MASGTLIGGGAGGDGSREKQRWSGSKVYTRKIHHKKPPNPNPNPPLPPSSPSHQTLPAPAVESAPTIAAANSSPQQPPPPDHDPPAPPFHLDSAASTLNHRPLQNGGDVITIKLSSQLPDHLRDLRSRLTSELEQVRSAIRRLETRELQLTPHPSAPAIEYSMPQYEVAPLRPSAPAIRYSMSRYEVTPLPSKRAPAVSETGSAAYALHRRQLSISVQDFEPLEKEKRTPKANQYYQNSEFLLAKDKLPPAEIYKKSKMNGSKKHEHGMHTVDRKMYSQAFKNCGSLLSSIMKHKFGWVFNKPVDVKGLGLHDYYTIIRSPMDLGTVRSRLSKNWYKTPEEFAEDVRLTFDNAMLYNPKGQDAHFMAEHLLQMFEEGWTSIESECSRLRYPPAPTRPLPVDMRKTLERSDSTAHPMAVDPKPNQVRYVPHIPHTSRPPALKKPKAKDLHKRDMTFEEKQKLSNNLQNLPPEKLDNIVQIIKKRNTSLNQHDDEIEVDIDSVDVETLWELDRFVTNYKKSLSKHKRRAELAMIARANAEQHMQGRVQERIPDNGALTAPKESRTVVDENNKSNLVPSGEKKDDSASRSSSSNSSSSDSGSSSSDSDSESSSGYGSDTACSPRT